MAIKLKRKMHSRERKNPLIPTEGKPKIDKLSINSLTQQFDMRNYSAKSRAFLSWKGQMEKEEAKDYIN